ncbi:MAG: sigma-70 family RNA polymerase sigma factor [Bacteroidetes bacterium]|nr:MAG: sigma-70 family RNA polymerase sigma factor [Bacteroidota bacterium]
MSPKDQALLRRIQTDDKQALEEIYLAYQNDFLRLARRQGISQADALDIYQDVVVAFFQQSQCTGFVLQQGIKAYLMGIGRYKCYEVNRQKNRYVALIQAEEVDQTTAQQEDNSERQQQLRRAFRQLSPSCQEVLRLFYYRGLSLADIVAQTDYKNTTTVKSHKSRCLKRLSQLIKSLGP